MTISQVKKGAFALRIVGFKCFSQKTNSEFYGESLILGAVVGNNVVWSKPDSTVPR